MWTAASHMESDGFAPVGPLCFTSSPDSILGLWDTEAPSSHLTFNIKPWFSVEMILSPGECLARFEDIFDWDGEATSI